MTCPESAFAGDKIDFSFSLPGYPAGAGWSCTVKLRNGSAVQSVTLTASGDSHTGSAAPGATAAWAPGIYDLFVLATKGGDRQTAYQSQLIVRPDPAAATPSKTALEADLDKVDAAISAVLNGQGIAAYTIQTQAGSRQIQRMSLADLRAHRAWLLSAIDAERLTLGEKPKNKRWRRIGLSFR